MPCNLVNFIFGEPGIGGLAGTAAGRRGGRERETGKKKRGTVGKTPVGKEKQCRGERICYHHHGFDDVQRCPVGSVSVQAWRPGKSRAQQPGGEEESKRAARTTCFPFIGAFAHAQSMSAYVQFLPCVLPA